jgi:DNA-binding winged helix-turn-helix (wHTH) protein
MNQMGEFKKALDYFDLSSKELAAKSCWNLLGYTFLGRGISYKKLNEYKTSITYFNLVQYLINPLSSKKLVEKVNKEIGEVNDSNIDFFIDRHNRLIHEKELGTIDFKHRFVLLEILFLLAQNPGKFYDKDALSKDIWKDEYNPLIHDKLIYTSVSRLRKLIEPNPEKSKYILRGKDGYTFNPHVLVSFYQGADVSNDSIANVEIGSPL